jgi:protein-S-isoprenylcysteine O-methyltransferase Ste14
MGLRNKIIDDISETAGVSSRSRTIMTPILATIFLSIPVFLIFLSLWLDRELGLPMLVPVPWNFIIAVPVMCGGLFLMLWCVFRFFVSHGTPVPINPPPVLITNGPYSCCRNPMLSGIFILMVGLGIFFSSISLLFIFTPLFILCNFIWLKMIEEPELEKRLGEGYKEYRKRVPMFFVRLWRKK